MGRKPRSATGEGAVAAAPAERVIRRRRPRQTVDHIAQTQVLVSAGDALAVVSWARGVHAEGAELKALATRARKVNAPGVAERKMAYEVNKALLDGVLAGATTINVGEDGGIVFCDSNTPLL
jgi:hypothetical protein